MKEPVTHIDVEQRYRMKLDMLKEKKEIDGRQRDAIIAMVEAMRLERDELREDVEYRFLKIQEKEKEIGFGLINTKTGKEIPSKVGTKKNRSLNLHQKFMSCFLN